MDEEYDFGPEYATVEAWLARIPVLDDFAREALARSYEVLADPVQRGQLRGQPIEQRDLDDFETAWAHLLEVAARAERRERMLDAEHAARDALLGHAKPKLLDAWSGRHLIGAVCALAGVLTLRDLLEGPADEQAWQTVHAPLARAAG